MNVPDRADQTGSWLRVEGPESDVALSSRVRLARNVAGYPFLSKASDRQKAELVELCRRRIESESLSVATMLWVDLEQLGPTDRQLLVERHLISRQHADGTGARCVFVSEDECVAVMVNEEDHLRIQVLRSGMDVEQAYRQANEVDDALEQRIDYAFSEQLGYLTACPTNVGTGVRVSAMLHLPALKLTGEIEKVTRAAKDMRLAVRGFHGEGTDAIGDLYQVSNQTTLGRSEGDILHDFQDVVMPELIAYERRARRALVEKRSMVIDDRVHRAVGVLSHSRLLSCDEAMQAVSYLRLGLCLDRLSGISFTDVNDLFHMVQPAHLQKLAGGPLKGVARREYRARIVRERMIA